MVLIFFDLTGVFWLAKMGEKGKLEKKGHLAKPPVESGILVNPNYEVVF